MQAMSVMSLVDGHSCMGRMPARITQSGWNSLVGRPNTTVALLVPAGIAAVGSGIFGLWLGASASIGTSQAQNHWNALASIPSG